MVKMLSMLTSLTEAQAVQRSMLQSSLRHLQVNHAQPELPANLVLPLRTLDELYSFDEKASQKSFFDAMVSLHVAYSQCRPSLFLLVALYVMRLYAV